MNCIHCQGGMVKGTTPFHVDRKGCHLMLDAVPAWVCEQCGEAYEAVTGERVDIHTASERPDFVCVRGDGTEVGVELVKVTRGDPNEILWDSLIEKRDYMLVDEALLILQKVAAEKEDKRREPDWRFPEATVLVIELNDIPLAHIHGLITPGLLPDLYSTGFAEVWLADFTGLEAYDNVALFTETGHIDHYLGQRLKIPK